MSCSKSKILIVICLLAGTSCWAQYRPVYDQYMFNGLALNPAFAGSGEVLSLSALCRFNRLSGFEGAPVTQTLSGDFPLRNPQVALGLLVFNDQIAIYRQTGLFASYAFRVKLGPGKLSLGLQAGFSQMREDESRIHTLDRQPDPMFSSGIYKFFMPNVGVGAFYYTPQYFAGLSLPQLLSYSPQAAASYKGRLSMENIMLYGGVTVPVSSNLKIRPSALLQYASGILCDLNCNVLLFPGNRLEFGISYRNAGTLVAMTEIRVNPQICVGYAFDHALGKLNAISSSHEIMVRYEFRYRIKAENPLYLK